MTWIIGFIAGITIANAGFVTTMIVLSRRMDRCRAEIARILPEAKENIKILEERADFLRAAEEALAQHCVEAGIERVEIVVDPGTKH